MTTEQRIDTLEEGIASLVAWTRKAGETIDLLVAQGIRVERLMEKHQQEHKEYQRDAEQYRRLWTHLARKHGWLDDGDWPQSGQK